MRDLGLSDVCLIGNSLGGWIAAELALAESAAPDSRVSSAILIDAVGLQLDAAPLADYFLLTRDQVFDLAYFNPDQFRVDPASRPWLSGGPRTASCHPRTARPMPTRSPARSSA